MAKEHEHAHEHVPMALPPAAQQLLMQLQTFQQQYQTVAIQKESLMIQKLELEKALEELAKAADKEEVFKAVGTILIRSTKAVLTKEMSEKKESVDVRLKSVDAQEKKVREKINEIQTRLQSMLGGPENHVEQEELEGESAG
jgi:prefoldin beta subunit